MIFKVFVVMPFGLHGEYKGNVEEGDFIYTNIIIPAVEQGVADYCREVKEGIFQPENNVIEIGKSYEVQLEITRQRDVSDTGNITLDIVENIARSHITIVDLTGKNPNVFLELGIRYALQRNGTILISQNTDDIPFNVSNYQTINYSPFYKGIEEAIIKLRNVVAGTMRNLSRIQKPTDSLVFTALDDLAVSLGERDEGAIISWPVYWHHVREVTSQLLELRSAGAYIPHILLGVSNGGLLLADTCLRLVYSNQTPLISLWAFRFGNNEYFDNPLNNAVIRPDLLQELGKNNEWTEGQKLRILILDDITATMRTFKQLLGYLEKRLENFYKEVDIKFVFLYTPYTGDISELNAYRLERDPNLEIKFPKLGFGVKTRSNELPYAKTVHYGNVVSHVEGKEEE